MTWTNGTHTLLLTFTHSGAQSLNSKQSSTEAVTVDCAPEAQENPCADAAASSQVQGNHNVCSTSTSGLPVTFTGNCGNFLYHLL